jgi:GLPGLI family protein
MLAILFRHIIFVAAFFLNTCVAQDSLAANKSHSTIPANNLTVSYSISVQSPKGNPGIGETYNGSIKTIFISGDKVRVRLVSLMRMQSIFIFPKIRSDYAAIITKESGKDKYKYYLSPAQWKQYNNKYDSVTCKLSAESAVILNYPCHKAIISLKDGTKITLYYTDKIKRKEFALAEPIFSCVPGLVLQYEYQYKKGKIIYTAMSVNENDIDPTVFKVPEKDFSTRKFSTGLSSN